MIKFPVLPENLAGLSDSDLDALKVGFRKIFALVKDGTYSLDSQDSIDAVEKGTADYDAVKAEVASRKEAAAKIETLRAAAEAALADEDDVEEDDAEAAEEAEEEAESEGESEGAEDDEGDDADGEAAAANEKTFTHLRSAGRPRKGVGAKATEALQHAANQFQAADGVPGKRAKEAFVNYEELAEALWERSRTKPREDVSVASAFGKYPKERIIEDESPRVFNLAGLDGGWGKGTEEELTAAFCAPCTPYYDISCANTDRRPVFNSLPQFQAPRGCVTIYPSPTLADITGGHGLWDKDDDAATPLVPKNACMTISCANSTAYYFYGVYRCLTVQNFLQMTFPELVAAYLNLLAAASAREAEKQLLDLLAVGTNTITASAMGLSGSASLSVQLQHYMDGYAERARWDTPQMEMWAPRWLQGYLKTDITLRKNLNGGPPRVGTDADVASLFSDLGITPHWYMDTPTWGTAAPTLGTGVANIPNGPGGSVKILLAPRGKYALIDRGELRVGVSGNNIYRDNTSNSLNQFTMFFETFEGIVDTNTCPADLVTLPLCFNGVQVGDTDSTDCAGLSEGPS